MLLPLVVFLLSAVLPVFFGRLRAAPFWVSVQALALAWALSARHPEVTMHSLIGVIEVLLVRGVLAPWLLRRVIERRGEADLDLMPSNLFAWASAVALIVLAFEFGGAAVSETGTFTMGVVGATVAIAFLVLSTNESPPAQWVALLFMENALALFESLLPDPWALPVHGSLSLVYLLTLGVGAFLLTPDVGRRISEPEPAVVDEAGAVEPREAL